MCIFKEKYQHPIFKGAEPRFEPYPSLYGTQLPSHWAASADRSQRSDQILNSDWLIGGWRGREGGVDRIISLKTPSELVKLCGLEDMPSPFIVESPALNLTLFLLFDFPCYIRPAVHDKYAKPKVCRSGSVGK